MIFKIEFNTYLNSLRTNYTSGNIKKYSVLNIYHFLKVIDILSYTKKGLKHLSESAIKIAEYEGFQAYKKSIEERLKEKN